MTGDIIESTIWIMDITLSIEDEVIRKARLHADTRGTTVDQIMRDYLVELSRNTEMQIDLKKSSDEFVRLSKMSHGNSKGWKYDREEAYKR